ncbi:MAG TPA: hypothetical protein VMY37_03545 [Thermoguttaceae bacterium]|nr:hypothetical protein [Thermoguttaceae bacterium]
MDRRCFIAGTALGGAPHTPPRSGSHEREWGHACKGGPTPLSDFDYSGPVMELPLLGNVAGLFDQPLEFDPARCRIVNREEADRAIRAEYRDGWSL